jgi:zinc transport system substrate-binding protein
MKLRQVILLVAVAIALGIGGFAIANNSGHKSDKLNVVASYYPLFDFAKQVGGNKVSIKNMTPAGAEPHDYEPSPKALVEAQESAVFIYNGGKMEPWADKFLADYNKQAVKASSGIQLREGKDPHFWLDPVLAEKIVNNIRDGFVKADPANKTYYEANAASYNKKLAMLNDQIKDGLTSCKQRSVISSHEAFGYFAKRYDIDVISIAGISPEEEPSAARLAEISDIVKEKGIGYIFFESLVSPRLADTIAQETGAKTLVFDPIEGLSDADQKQGKDYISVQKENLQNLRTALSCS